MRELEDIKEYIVKKTGLDDSIVENFVRIYSEKISGEIEKNKVLKLDKLGTFRQSIQGNDVSFILSPEFRLQLQGQSTPAATRFVKTENKPWTATPTNKVDGGVKVEKTEKVNVVSLPKEEMTIQTPNPPAKKETSEPEKEKKKIESKSDSIPKAIKRDRSEHKLSTHKKRERVRKILNVFIFCFLSLWGLVLIYLMLKS